MPTPSDNDLESFLLQQAPATLVAVLLELARDHEAVQSRLTRLQLADQPNKLAAGFRKSLNAWRRSTRYFGYSEAGAYGRALESWLDQVESDLLHKDPAAALALFEAFIEADVVFFERADDSGGCIGDAVRTASRLWLKAAACCDTSSSDWPGRIVKLFSEDQYGAREELLRSAQLLLDEKALRAVVTLFEARMAVTLAGQAGSERPPIEVFRISAALSLLSEALRDPDVKVRAVMSYSPQPNSMQQKDFAEAYLGVGRLTDALTWLHDSWGNMEGTRLSLLSDTLGRLGRRSESAVIRQNLFERSISVVDLHRWLEHLPEAARPEALERAHQLALDHDDPTTAATLLLDLGDHDAAEAVLLADPARIRGDNYTQLRPIVQAMRAHQHLRGEAAICRAMLTAILNRAYTPAYVHGAGYLVRLRGIAATGAVMRPLESHEDFEESIRSRHARKSSFWAHVNGKRSARTDDHSDE